MTSFLGSNKGLVDFDQKSLAGKPVPGTRWELEAHARPTVAAASIAFNPIFWK